MAIDLVGILTSLGIAITVVQIANLIFKDHQTEKSDIDIPATAVFGGPIQDKIEVELSYESRSSKEIDKSSRDNIEQFEKSKN